MENSKAYGKLSSDQLRQFVDKLPILFSMLLEIDVLLAKTPASKFDEVMSGEYGQYSHLYELDFREHLAVVVVAFNRHEDLAALVSTPDPQQALIDSLFLDREDKPLNAAFGESATLAMGYSLFRTIKSIANYGRSISSLLQDVRDTGACESLFKAIRMDRAVIGCPTAMQRIARAQMRGDVAFFKRLRSALSGPSKKEWRGLDRLRYVFLLLREMGINGLSEEALEDLMVSKLEVYHPGMGNARKNLRAHYRHSRKLHTL